MQRQQTDPALEVKSRGIHLGLKVSQQQTTATGATGTDVTNQSCNGPFDDKAIVHIRFVVIGLVVETGSRDLRTIVGYEDSAHARRAGELGTAP